MGLEAPAFISAINPCPPLSETSDTTRTVIGKFRHTANEVLHFTIEGLAEPIGVTPLHPFWSVEQATYVPARDLAPGDHVLGQNGPIEILSIEPLPGSHEVINLEIHYDHVFNISELAVLVHNSCPANFDAARVEAFEKAGMTNPDFIEFSKMDPVTGTVVEFKGPDGAKVGYDTPHVSPGHHHDVNHISWQSGGKRNSGALPAYTA